MKLKICGLKTLNDIDFVNRANIDFAGFVFAPSKQQITVETAKTLKSALNPNIKAVGVFVDESYEFIKNLIDENIIDMVQFHGDVEYEMPCPTIRAFRMRTADDIKPTNCDFALFDSYREGTRGSTGGMFDWRLIDGYNAKPFFLAGGINITNLRQAMELNPYCIDISSGAEDENGDKSLDKILKIKDVLNYE
ncbi:MAG: phosphoribosylanthranilate isomerase [Oscillospiraceae bacterium]|nr:phosphoribosylanthranilate isomerase [Oscillospiraceae bacterium]